MKDTEEPVSKLRVNRVGSAGANATPDYARSQATHRQAATESFKIGSETRPGKRYHGLFDTHFHYRGDEPPGDYADRARAAGVEYLLAVGGNSTESGMAAKFAESTQNAWFSAGIHPHDASGISAGDLERVDEFLSSPRAVAVGETGLDYFYENSPSAAQRKLFESFLGIGLNRNLPVIVHCRDSDGSAYSDALEILRDFVEDGGRFVVHCYTGTPSSAEKFMELGGYIGFTGIVTFKSAGNVRESLSTIPVERLFLETDSPYLAPVPYRGRENHPEYLPLVLESAANVKKLKPEDLAAATTRNAVAFFKTDGVQNKIK